MVVGLTYDLRTDYVPGEGDPPDANAEFDSQATIDLIAGAIRSAGHDVVLIGNVWQLLQRLDDLAVDVVFNVAEGRASRNRESQVPMLLELKGIPYIGADALALGVSLDKVVAKQLFLAQGIPTARYFCVDDAATLTSVPLPFPLLVKPRHEGSSKGLSEQSMARSLDALKAETARVIGAYRQPALVEEFIAGTEFTVAVIGNDPPEALPIVQITIDDRTELGDLFYTHSRITSPALGYLCPAKISPAMEQSLRALAVRAYQAIDCRDFGRVDFRVDRQGRPFVLEINPLPSFSSDDVFMAIANALGVPYESLIHRMLNAAFARLGLEPCPTPSR